MREVKCNSCSIREKVQISKNHLVLDTDRVYKLLGVAEDEFDWYYIMEDLHGNITRHSCVGGFTDLYNLLPHNVYATLEKLFKLNQANHPPSTAEPPVDVLETLYDKCYCSSLFSDVNLRRHIDEVILISKIRKDLLSRGVDPDSTPNQKGE